MTWKVVFDKGVACFKRGDLQQALTLMDQGGSGIHDAAELESSNFIIFDSRAAVHEKLGDIKAALLDSKRVIDLAPDRWQGYARSARLFDILGKHGHVIKMADHALSHLRSADVQRCKPVVILREKAMAAQAAAEKQVVLTSYLLGKLPVETLVEIFTLLIDKDHAWAIKLSHVCGHWRRILINTPHAWKTLAISRKYPSQKVKLWKERTKNRIARISVDVSELERASVFAQLQDLSWDNLSSLRILGKAFIELHRMLSDLSLPYAFSKLCELELVGCMSHEELSCCLSGPDWNLRILRLNGSIQVLGEPLARIQRLKELYLDGLLLGFSTQVLTNNPSLERLVLNCGVLGPVSGFDNDASPTSMDNLRVIECRGLTQPFDVLRAISTPLITHFTMVSATVADQPLLHIASHSSLVELHIGSCSLSPSTLPTLLSFTPNLETLGVNSIHTVVNDMFAFLTPKIVDLRHGLPCPGLRHVDVSRCSDLTTSSVYAFVKTRALHASESTVLAERCAVVASLKVDGCPNIEPELLPWFRSRVAQFSCVYGTRKDFAKSRRRKP